MSESGSSTKREAEGIVRLLNEWMADEPGYDEETWPELKAALERNRLSSRSLFEREEA